MRVLKHLSLFTFALMIFAAGAFAQAAAGKTQYTTVEIEKFTVAEGVEFPAADLDELVTYMVLHFKKSNRFENVFLSTDAAAQTAPARRVKISGVVTKYAKGNRAARYLVGFGAGRTKLVADVKVTDAQTGEALIQQKVDGHVYIGMFGGATDDAKGGLASEIIKTMTKMGYAGAKKKS